MSRAVVVLLALALLAHAPGLSGGFVYDDHRFVAQNPALGDLTVASAFLDPATHTADRDRDVYRPLRTLGHAFDVRRWGTDPFGLHLHSLLVHLANVVLAYLVLRHLLDPDGEFAALCGAGLLAVHPVGVEVVDWISSRGDLYAVTLGLPALLVGTGALRSRGATLALGALLAAGATLGKESAATLPLVALVHRRLMGRGSSWAGPAGLALGVAAALGLRQVALTGLSPVQTPPHGGDLLSQACWALWGLARAAGNLAWPATLSVDPPQSEWAAAGFSWGSEGSRAPPLPGLAVGLALVAAPLVGLVRARAPRAAFAALWALLAYLPSSSLIVTLRTLVTDRALYPALPALGALLGLGLLRAGRARRPIALGLALLLAVVAARRTGAFASDRALWSDVLRSNPRSVQAHLGLAAVEAEEDPYAAGRTLRKALSVAEPGSKLESAVLARLGDHVLRREQDPAGAVPILEHALAATRRWSDRERPGLDEPATAASLAEAYTRQGRHDAAEAILGEAIARESDPTMLLVKLAQLRLMRAGDGTDAAARELALEALRAAAAASPGHPLVESWLRELEGPPRPGSEER